MLLRNPVGPRKKVGRVSGAVGAGSAIASASSVAARFLSGTAGRQESTDTSSFKLRGRGESQSEDKRAEEYREGRLAALARLEKQQNEAAKLRKEAEEKRFREEREERERIKAVREAELARQVEAARVAEETRRKAEEKARAEAEEKRRAREEATRYVSSVRVILLPGMLLSLLSPRT